MKTQVINIPEKNGKSVFSNLRGAHVAVRVPDFEESKKWYTEKLDFRVVHEWPFGELQLAYLAPANDDNFWVELLAGGNPTPAANYTDLNESLHPAGYHHFCIDTPDVDATIAELKRRGVTIVGEAFDLAEIGKRLAFISDPWGNLIEFSQQL